MTLTAYQAHMKRELKGKMAGKTAAQRKAIFRAAAASYKKKPSTRSRVSNAVKRVKSSRSSNRNKTSKSGGKHHMGNGGFNTQKLFKWMRVGALVLPAVPTIMAPTSIAQKINTLKSDYFGVWSDGSFHLESAAKGWTPFIFANVITYGIPKLISILRGR